MMRETMTPDPAVQIVVERISLLSQNASADDAEQVQALLTELEGTVGAVPVEVQVRPHSATSLHG